MKKLAILSAAFVLVALIGVSASAMRLTEDNALLATWDVTISAPGMELPGTFKLEKDGENFKGAVNTEMLQEAFPGYEAPVSPKEMADYIFNFALTGNKFYNGKVLQVSSSTP